MKKSKKNRYNKRKYNSRKKKHLKGGNLQNLDLTASELKQYGNVLKENPALLAMLNFDVPTQKKNVQNIEQHVKKDVEKDVDPIMLMIESVKQHTNNPNMNCKEIATFLENYDNAKKIFDDITQEELNAIIIATNNHKFCEMYNNSKKN